MLRPLYQPLEKRRRVSRGGWRQRSSAAVESSSDDEFQISRLAANRLQSWCDGNSSSRELQRDMISEVEDMRAMGQRVHPMVEQLSKIGSDQHAQEGLRKLLGSVGLLSMQTKLPVSEQVDTMVLPSSLVRLLHEHYPETSKCCSALTLRSFGSSGRRSWGGLVLHGGHNATQLCATRLLPT